MPHARNSTLTTGALTMRNQDFNFYLEHRAVDLGSAGRVSYYYMPVSRLRDNDPVADASNFRSCIGHWFAVVQEHDQASDFGAQANFVLATCYALVRRDKGMQRIYRDAMPLPKSFRNLSSKPSPEVCERIDRVIKDRDRAGIKRELDRALGAHQFSESDVLVVTEALQHWTRRGVQSFRFGNLPGLTKWLKEVEYWIGKYKKRSTPQVRLFVNAFSYECKLRFFGCYANFWIGLIPWLRAHRNLDAMSERFLRLWHNQNQPVEIPPGQTAGGILYPKHVVQRLRTPDGRVAEILCPTVFPSDNTIPDVFGGQVLALHPLSWILLSNRALRHDVGSYIASPAHDGGIRLGASGQLPEYWGMVKSILTAAYLYQELQFRNESDRAVRPRTKSHSLQDRADPGSSTTPKALLEGYVEQLQRLCPCGGKLYLQGSEMPVADGESCDILVRCCRCKLESVIGATMADLQAHLRANGAR